MYERGANNETVIIFYNKSKTKDGLYRIYAHKPLHSANEYLYLGKIEDYRYLNHELTHNKEWVKWWYRIKHELGIKYIAWQILPISSGESVTKAIEKFNSESVTQYSVPQTLDNWTSLRPDVLEKLIKEKYNIDPYDSHKENKILLTSEDFEFFYDLLRYSSYDLSEEILNILEVYSDQITDTEWINKFIGLKLKNYYINRDFHNLLDKVSSINNTRYIVQAKQDMSDEGWCNYISEIPSLSEAIRLKKEFDSKHSKNFTSRIIEVTRRLVSTAETVLLSNKG